MFDPHETDKTVEAGGMQTPDESVTDHISEEEWHDCAAPKRQRQAKLSMEWGCCHCKVNI